MRRVNSTQNVSNWSSNALLRLTFLAWEYRRLIEQCIQVVQVADLCSWLPSCVLLDFSFLPADVGDAVELRRSDSGLNQVRRSDLR